MPDETQFTFLCVSIAAALEKAAGGGSPDPGIPNTGSLDTPPPPGYSDSSLIKKILIYLTLESAVSLQPMLPEIHCETQSPI